VLPTPSTLRTGSASVRRDRFEIEEPEPTPGIAYSCARACGRTLEERRCSSSEIAHAGSATAIGATEPCGYARTSTPPPGAAAGVNFECVRDEVVDDCPMRKPVAARRRGRDSVEHTSVLSAPRRQARRMHGLLDVIAACRAITDRARGCPRSQRAVRQEILDEAKAALRVRRSPRARSSAIEGSIGHDVA